MSRLTENISGDTLSIFLIEKGHHDMFRGESQSDYFTSLGDFLKNKVDFSPTRFDYFNVKNLRLIPRNSSNKLYKIVLYSALIICYIYGLSW